MPRMSSDGRRGQPMTPAPRRTRAVQPGAIDHHERAARLLERHGILASKIAANCKLPPRLVAAALTEVVRFLDLCGCSQETLTPSLLVDNVWHEFILCTKAYEEYCARNFGRLIHHDPGGSGQDNRQQFARTLDLYQVHFGTPDPRFWGREASPNSPAPGCGSCRGLSA